MSVYIGMGSNLGESTITLKHAIKKLEALEYVTIHNISSLYITTPVGYQNQPLFYNAVMNIDTDYEPLTLLNQLQKIENEFGRKRAIHWGPRTLDLDLLLYHDRIVQLPQLVIPHPEITKRLFVLYPLAEIAPQIHIPQQGCIKKILANFCDHQQEIVTRDQYWLTLS